MASFLQTIARALAPAPVSKSLHSVDNRGGWWPVVREGFTGAWQKGITVTVEDALQYWAVFRCIGVIAGDIAKMRVKLVEEQSIGGIWTEVRDDVYAPLLARPNRKQTRIQFFRNWMESKLMHGNTYVLKERATDGRVVALYVLDPLRVFPLLNEYGDVYYELLRDDFIGHAGQRMVVPASEIIHDRWNTLYHPLVGLSPLYAAGINALAAHAIEKNTARLFQNGGRPGGILTAPHHIPDEAAKRAKEYWDNNFTGENAGKVAVLGDGMEYKETTMNAVDAQLIDQLRWNDTAIAGIFGVPGYKINVGNAPTYQNVEALNQLYYSDTLQPHIEDVELLLDEGLGMAALRRPKAIGAEFDLDGLLRMDTATLVRTYGEGVLKGIMKPDEARARLGLAPVEGGDAVYLQQQNFSLAALAKRDAMDDPFARATPETAPPEDEPTDEDDPDGAEKASRALEEEMAAP